MREALEEARAYRDPVNEASYSTQQIRMAYGILNDPRSLLMLQVSLTLIKKQKI